jgi:hypothetical protein
MMISPTRRLVPWLLASLTMPVFAQASDVLEIPRISRSGAHDFDFEHGEWRVHHRVKRSGEDGWAEFDGTCRDRGLIDGSANVEEHTFRRSTGAFPRRNGSAGQGAL